MKLRYLVSAIVALALAVPSLASAQPPSRVPIQAYLTNSQGMPIDGQQQITVRIFDQQSGGTALYEETMTVTADEGSFTAHLGSTKSLDLSIFRNNTDLWAELEVGNETLQPRLRIETAPYAAAAGQAETAKNAQQLGGQSASSYQYSAGNGLQKSGSTFSIDPSQTQARIGNQCGAGEAAYGVQQDGTLLCRPVASTIQTGPGLSKSGGAIRVAGSGITSSMVKDNTLAQSDISSGAIGTSELQNNAVTSSEIQDGQVQTSDLASGAVTNGKIASGAVGTGKLASGAVTSNKIANGTITDEDVDSSVTGHSDIDFNAAGELSIPSGAVDSSDIGTDAVRSDELDDNAVTSSHIRSGAVGSSEISNGSITYEDMQGAIGCDSNTTFSEVQTCDVYEEFSLPNCDEVAVGGVCEGSGNCPNTPDDANFCGTGGTGSFEVYVRTSW